MIQSRHGFFVAGSRVIEMLNLSGKLVSLKCRSHDVTRRLFTIFSETVPPLSIRNKSAWKVSGRAEEVPEGFACYLFSEDSQRNVIDESNDSVQAVLPSSFGYLREGDIVRIGIERATIATLFRRNSLYNTLLVTEQCNHYCLMCSQPPKRGPDRWLVEDAKEVVRMMPQSVESLGISGGEPTLLGEDLLELLTLTRSHLPHTQVDLLSNGRRFSDIAFCKAYAAIKHPNLTVGIPIYSDDPVRHNYIVQAEGAFDETVRGILNLKRCGQKVEVRVVLHAQSVPRLVETAEYLARNLLFVDHVALMGLEMTGFTLANIDSLWIDPYDYREELSAAVHVLRTAGMTVSVYNLPRCLVPEDVMPAYRKSISDWKNEYLEKCNPCSRRQDCGGFFSSAIGTKSSSHISPFN